MKRPGERLLFGGPWREVAYASPDATLLTADRRRLPAGDIARPLCEMAPWRTTARGRHSDSVRSLSGARAMRPIGRAPSTALTAAADRPNASTGGLRVPLRLSMAPTTVLWAGRNWTPPASNERPSHWPRRLSRGRNLGYAKTL